MASLGMKSAGLIGTTFGPNLPFSPWPTAAVRLHQTGHSSIAKHFRKMMVGNADEAAAPIA